MPRVRIALCVLLLLPALSRAAEWEAITAEVLKSVKTGYGGLCGVLIDHDSGTVYINLSDQGLYRSTDQGKTWQPTGEKPFKGRTETGGCLMMDPTGKSKRLVAALVYGAPISVSG